MKLITSLFCLALVVLNVSCESTRLQYNGPTYPATNRADVFYQHSSVSKPHTVMGTARLEAEAGESNSAIRTEFAKAARESGANGVVISDPADEDASLSGQERTVKGNFLRYSQSNPGPDPGPGPNSAPPGSDPAP